MRLFRGRDNRKADQEDKERMSETKAEAAPAAATDVPNVGGEAGTDAATGDTTSSNTAPIGTPESNAKEPEAAGDTPEETPPPQDNLLAQIGAEADAEMAKEEAEAAEADSAGDKDELDPELLDIFRDARNEVQESSLAAELDDIAVQELLNELLGIGSRLGIAAQGPARDRDHEGEKANEPPARTPDASEPSAQTPAASEPSAQTPAADEPSAQTPTANEPSAQTPTANEPSAQIPEGSAPHLH